MDIYIPGLPSLTRDLGVADSTAQLTVALFLVGLGVGQLFAGPLSDSFGRRRPVLVAIVAYCAVTVLCVAAPSIELLVACRLVQGFAAAAGVVIARAVVRDLMAGTAAARLLSRLVMIYGLAPVLAPVIGSQILRLTSWRGLFVGLAIFGAALLAATALWLPETLPPRRRYPLGVVRTLRVYAGLLRHQVFVGYGLALGLATGAIVSYVAGSSFVFQDVYGISPQAYGAVFGINAAAMVAGSQLNAHLVGRADPRRLLELAGWLVVAAAAAMTALLALGVGLAAVLPGLFLLMVCWGFIPANAIALAMADHRDVAGSSSAVLGIFQYGIGALGAPLVGISETSALPMALVILGLAAASAVAVAVLVDPQC